MTTPLSPEDVQANLDALKTQVPTLEEQMFSTCLATWNGDQYINYSFIASLMVAPMAMRVLSMSLVWDYYSQAASDASYWKLTLRKGDNADGYKDIATRATTATGQYSNGGVISRQAWTFDAAAWGNADLSKDDLLQVYFWREGTPTDMRMPLTATIRYMPL